jgi:hypothetical protein
MLQENDSKKTCVCGRWKVRTETTELGEKEGKRKRKKAQGIFDVSGGSSYTNVWQQHHAHVLVCIFVFVLCRSTSHAWLYWYDPY